MDYKSNVSRMNKLLADVRSQYPDIDKPGFKKNIRSTSINSANRKLHYDCLLSSFDYAFEQQSGVYGVDVDVCGGKTYSLLLSILNHINEGKFGYKDVFFVTQNSDITALKCVVTDYPNLNKVAEKFLNSCCFTYAGLTRNYSVKGSNVDKKFTSAKFIIFDEGHNVATQSALPITQDMLKAGLFKVFLFTSTIGKRFDDKNAVTSDYFNNLLNAQILYRIHENEMFTLNILLTPLVYSLANDSDMDELIEDLIANKKIPKRYSGLLSSITTDQKVRLIKTVSGRELFVDITQLAPSVETYIKTYKTGKILRCLLIGSSIEDLIKSEADLKRMLDATAKSLNKTPVYTVSHYTGEYNKNERTKIIEDFESKTSTCSDSELDIRIMSGVYAISRSIHPHGLNLMYMSRNAKASMLREQAAGRAVSSSDIPVFVIDPFNSLDYGLQSNGVSIAQANVVGGALTAPKVPNVVIFPNLTTLNAFAKMELDNLTDEELSNLTQYLMEHYYDCSKTEFYSRVEDNFNVSKETVKVLLESLQIESFDFKDSSECRMFVYSSLLTELSMNNLIEEENDGVVKLKTGAQIIVDKNGVCSLLEDGQPTIFADLMALFGVGVMWDSKYYETKRNAVVGTAIKLIA